MKIIGLIINPIAGMGGRVGLKGTDNDMLQEAKKRGATPIAGKRTERFLLDLIRYPEYKEISFVVPSGTMGANIFREIQQSHQTLTWQELTQISIPEVTSRKHTELVATALKKQKIDLLIFIGGDGTAHDILQSVGSEFPMLGIPSGVKMHSGVFSQRIGKGVEILRKFVRNEVQFVKSEVIDTDEASFRKNRIVTKLFGLGLVPQAPSLMQLTKTSSSHTDTEEENLNGIIKSLRELIDPEKIYFLGPGSTIKEINRVFGETAYEQKTLLGVDAIQNNNLIGKDLAEADILHLLNRKATKAFHIIVTPIGGQGFIFGRGNQQFTPQVIRKVGLDQILVVATQMKINTLPNRLLHVDTGDPSLDTQFTGFIKVLVDFDQFLMVKVD